MPSKRLNAIYMYVLYMHACVLSRFSCVQLFCDPMDCSPPGSSVHAIFLGKNTVVGLSFTSPGDLSDPEIEISSPSLAGNSIPLSHLGSHLL